MSAQLLRAAIEAELEGVSLRELGPAADALSLAYRAEGPAQAGPYKRSGDPGAAKASGLPERTNPLRSLAYLVVRMPATYAAAAAVLSETAGGVGPLAVSSLLDLGAGPGTLLWAAADVWPTLARATLIDRDAAMLALGQRLWAQHPRASAMQVDWRPARLTANDEWPAADLVTLSYVLGELSSADRTGLVERALAAARVAVVIVEPGTPAGYRTMLEARGTLAAGGATIAAPCPHGRACPLGGTDWCHFGVRLERSRAHRLLKHAELAWEDEKFSYVVGTKTPAVSGAARILRRPLIEKGRIDLRLCTSDGLDRRTITRKDAVAWRAARHVRWGETWPPRSQP